MEMGGGTMEIKTMKKIFIVEVFLAFIIFLIGKSFASLATYVLVLAMITKLFIFEKEMEKISKILKSSKGWEGGNR
jgi:hypothetical protein